MCTYYTDDSLTGVIIILVTRNVEYVRNYIMQIARKWLLKKECEMALGNYTIHRLSVVK